METFDFNDAKTILWKKLGDWKIMALASCADNYPMVRNVSCIIKDEVIYFKTDKHFRKTKQLYVNPQVALCSGGVQVEGKASVEGLVVEEQNRFFEDLYKQYLWQSYNAYSHKDTEILVKVTPEFVEIWDEDDQHHAFQIFLDMKKKRAFYKPYDEKK